jgi:Carboxypeptidase regulatory-like domain
VCWELEKSVVFRGTVIRVGPPLRFQVHEIFSGTPPDVVEVANAPDGCGLFFQFKPGEQYLVYARSVGDRLTINSCTRTAPLEQTREELEVLRELKRGVRKPRLIGRVVESRGGGFGLKEESLPLSAVRITATAPNGTPTYSTTTDGNGEYRFTDIQPGRYSIRVHLPPRYPKSDYEYERTRMLECFENVSFTAVREPLSGVLMRQVGSWGDLSGQTISAVAVDSNGAIGDELRRMETYTDREGRWRFRGLPPGRYKVGVNVFRKVRWDPWQQPVWYGGAIDPSSARVVEIAEDGTRSIVIRFPPAPAEISIAGVLVNRDGNPVQGMVSVYDVAIGESVSGSSTDGAGRFAARGWEGRRHAVVGFACKSLGLMSENIDVPNSATEQLRVTLTKPCKRR